MDSIGTRVTVAMITMNEESSVAIVIKKIQDVVERSSMKRK